jgi:glycosyltransferase involved in cell wall biosynthesis
VRIGLDASLASGGGSGTARYAELLVRHLVAASGGDEEYLLYFRRRDRGRNPLLGLGGGGVHAREVDAPHSLLRVHVSLARALRRDRADVYHGLAFFAPWLWPGKAVITVHDIHPILLREHWWQPGSRRAYLVMRVHIPLAIRRARFVLAPSAYVRDTILARYRLPPDRVVVTPHGADPFFGAAPPLEDVARAAARFGPDPFFLYVGALGPQKNTAGLIRALARLRAEGSTPAPRLLLVGRSAGPYRSRVLAPLIERLGLEGAVTFAGYVDDAQLRALYHRAAAVVVPSFAEGFGLPLLEAMTSGAPVIAAATSSLPEVGGDAPLYVDPREPAEIAAAMARIAREPDLRQELGARGRARALAFSWERCVARVRECYRG